MMFIKYHTIFPRRDGSIGLNKKEKKNPVTLWSTVQLNKIHCGFQIIHIPNFKWFPLEIYIVLIVIVTEAILQSKMKEILQGQNSGKLLYGRNRLGTEQVILTL